MCFAEVAVINDLPFRQAFSYRVPYGMTVTPGDAVLVPFGPRHLLGVVAGVGEAAAYEGTVRDIAVAGEQVVAPERLRLARRLSEHYLATLGECVELMLPPEATKRIADTVLWTGGDLPDFDKLTPADRDLAVRIQASVRATPATLRRSFGGTVDAALARLEQLGFVQRRMLLTEPAATKAAKREPGERTVAPALSGAQERAVTRITTSLVGRHAETYLLHGVTGSGKTEVYLAAVEAALQQGRGAIVLVPEIALTPQAVDRIERRFPGQVSVSHSGLTPAQRYKQWLDVRAGLRPVVVGARSALFMPVPDLGLIVLDEEHEWSYKQQDPAPRYHAREAARALALFSDAVVILGSATPDVVSYYRATQGRYHLLELPARVGGRRPTSPTALPTTPRLSVGEDGSGPAAAAAREDHAAIVGEDVDWNISTLRGPALQVAETPPQPSYTTAPAQESAPDLAAGIVTADEPAQQAQGAELPPVSIVNLATELREGNRGIFSRVLESALTDVLRNGEQAILFLNRRGSASFILCRDCGHVPRCQSCLVALTYHQGAERLRCHYCNRRRRVPETCTECGSRRIRFLGLGTQRVEEEVRNRFPTARVLRWDRDVARTAADHAALLETFAKGEADILVGTQMIAKGLDLPNVTLVGVVCADIALNLPHYRTGERAFQILTQVAGRAGRAERPGRVILQTYEPKHYAIVAASGHDYAAMYAAELDLRQRAGYPPFGRLAQLTFSHTNSGQAEREAARLGAELRAERERRGLPAIHIIGPAPAFHAKLRGRWRWSIIVRATDPAELLKVVELPRGWHVDVDPIALV